MIRKFQTRQGNRGELERVAAAQAFRAQLLVPEQRQLYDYWQELAGPAIMPTRADLDPTRIPRLLPGLSLLDANASAGLCRVRLAGTRLREVLDKEITGLTVRDVPCGNKLDYWLAAYQRTIEHKTPTQGVIRGPIVNKEHVVQYWLKLPLRTTSDEVGMILCYDHFVPASELGLEQDSRISVAS